MAFRRKAEYILTYSPDILIVPECEHIDKIKFPKTFRQPTDKLWFGKNQNKGLAVFSFCDFRFRVLDIHNENFKMIIPIAVTGEHFDFNLFAIWANNPSDKDGHYVTQIWKAINHYDSLLSEKSTILMGDFNSNTIWDYKKHRLSDHSSVVKFLESKNIFSTYHLHHKQTQGKEIHPTLYMYRHQQKPYHIDYCFVSADLADKLKSVEVGDYETWIKYSDHTPLIATFEMN
jgi:exodeoxyribonuclease III